MWFTNRPDRTTKGYYSCGRSRLTPARRGCSAHYITLEELNDLVLGEITRVAAIVKANRKNFIRRLIRSSEKELEKANARANKEIEECNARIDELNIVAGKVYEDRVFNRISDDAFTKLYGGYGEEINKLSARIMELERSLEQRRASNEEIRSFVDLIEKYTDLKQMTAEIAN